MTVSPLAGVTAPTTFATKAKYEFKVDLDGDAVEESVHTVTFSKPDAAGKQSVVVAQKGPGLRGKSKGATGAAFQTSGGTRVQCGVFDDPFFFDILGFRKGFQFSEQTSSNFFRGLNTLAIVLDVPNSVFGDATDVGVWCTTTLGRKQIDREGRPAINAALIGAPRKDEFNATRPRDDRAKFRTDVINRITTLRGGNGAGVPELADVLLPDVLTFQPGNTAGFLNGRRLEDDVIDAALNLLTSGALTTDYVASDSAFTGTFPFLAPPNP
jgi:hypothetical protein